MTDFDLKAGGPIALVCMIAGTTMIAGAEWGLFWAGFLLVIWSGVLIWSLAS